MTSRPHMDAFGAVSLIFISALLGFNQVLIKYVNEGVQPVFAAGIRSLGAVFCIWIWMRLRGLSLAILPGTVPAGVLIGVVFATEFVFLFTALDLGNVTEISVILYSMPLWLALASHFLLPGEQMTRTKAVGLALAFCGVALAIGLRPGGAATGAAGGSSLVGNLCALVAALSWAAIALLAKGSRLREVSPEMQLMWQVGISAPLLLMIAPVFGPLLRDPEPMHLAGLGVQTVVVVSFGFVFWLWLLARYPANAVASFGFLTPVFGVGFGWLLLGEPLGWPVLAALGFLVVGLVLINRPAPAPAHARA